MQTVINYTTGAITLGVDFPITWSDGGVFVIQINANELLGGEEMHVALSVLTDPDLDVWLQTLVHDIVHDTDPAVWTSPPIPCQYGFRATLLQAAGAGALTYGIIVWRLDFPV